MRKQMLPSFLFILLALLMLFLPAEFLIDWRLSLYGSATVASELASPGHDSLVHPPAQDSLDRIRILQERLVQRDAEVAALRRRLSELDAARENLPAMRFVYASVMAAGKVAFADTYTVDRGRRDGVREGDAVVQGTVLFGSVARCAIHTALVRSVYAGGSLVPARTGKTREICAVRGDGGDRATAIFYTTESGADKGEPLLTSGLLGELPEGLLVGELLARPEEGAEPGTLEAPVRLYARPHMVEGLLLLHRLEPAAPARTGSGE